MVSAKESANNLHMVPDLWHLLKTLLDKARKRAVFAHTAHPKVITKNLTETLCMRKIIMKMHNNNIITQMMMNNRFISNKSMKMVKKCTRKVK